MYLNNQIKLKFPGQLRVCDNAVPDITFGLKKRPPAEYIGTLNNANSSGHWYEILRDGDEKFLVQITESDAGTSTKPIKIWDLLTGNEQTLTNNANDSVFSYLQQSGNQRYAVTTIQDYTLIANPDKTVAIGTGTVPTPIENGRLCLCEVGYCRLIILNIFYITLSSQPLKHILELPL